MNLIEAVKSGRNFKRSMDEIWLEVHPESKQISYRGGYEAPLSANDLVAEDWEIEEEAVQVTRRQIIEAFCLIQQPFTKVGITDFLKELGFEDEK